MTKNYKLLYLLLLHIVTYRILTNNLLPDFNVPLKWRNWVKIRAVAFSRLLAIYIDVNWEKNSMTAILHFLEMILIWVWNINEIYVFIMKFKLPSSLLPESSAQFLNSLYQFYMKIIISNVHWQNMSNFSSVVLQKFRANVQQYLLICGINDK